MPVVDILSVLLRAPSDIILNDPVPSRHSGQHVYNPRMEWGGRKRQEDHKFGASLGHLVRPYLTLFLQNTNQCPNNLAIPPSHTHIMFLAHHSDTRTPTDTEHTISQRLYTQQQTPPLPLRSPFTTQLDQCLS